MTYFCNVCAQAISMERLQLQPRAITCSPGCTRENQLAKGRLRAKRQYERRTREKEAAQLLEDVDRAWQGMEASQEGSVAE